MSRQQRSWSHQVENTRELILDSDRLAIIMVGLPARGKSFMAKKIYRYLCHLQLITKIFNFGSYRRIATKNTTVGKASASFFDPENKEGARIREQCCVDALHDLISWYNTGGQIGILDATNTTLARRKLIRDFFATKRSELEYNVALLHVESICNDQNKIHQNIITVKLKNPDYCTVDAKKAIQDFKERIKMYEKKYHEVTKREGSYIKIIDVGTEVKGHQINDYISCRIFYFLMHLHLHALTKTPRKPLLMQLKNQIAAQEDREQEERLKKISEGIGAKFTRKYDRPIHALAPHMRRPSYLMWSDAEDTYKEPKAVTPISPNHNPQTIMGTTPISPNTNPPRVMASNIDTIAEDKSHNDLMSNFQFTPGQYHPVTPGQYHMVAANISAHASPVPMLASSNTLITPTDANCVIIQKPQLRSQHSVRKSKYIHRALSRMQLPKIAKSQSDSVSDTDNDNGNDSDSGTDLNTSMDEEDKDDDEEVDCEICSRTVKKRDTHLVESRRSSKKKVRICEICLYETDSEGDDAMSDVEDQRYVEMHSVPAYDVPMIQRFPSNDVPLIQRYPSNPIMTPHDDEEIKLRREKTEQMRMSVTYLVDQLDNKKSVESAGIKERLIKLREQMNQFLND